ncbi:MAG: hypothetical protein LAT55_13240 [Opitutales bacterium]|nr:hypothetical protein [Opitutales bacterium]
MNKLKIGVLCAVLATLNAFGLYAGKMSANENQIDFSLTVKATSEVVEAFDEPRILVNIFELKTRQRIIRQNVTLNKASNFTLSEGKYIVQAIKYSPWHVAKTQIRVPEDGDIVLELKEPEKHSLTIRLVDEDGDPVVNSPVSMSFSDDEEARFFPRGSSSSQANVTTDENGLAPFGIKGTLPSEVRFRSSDRKLHRIERSKVTADEFKQKDVLEIEVIRKAYNGQVSVFLEHDGEKMPFEEGLGKHFSKETLPRVLRLQSIQNERRYFTFRVEDDAVELYGLEDGGYRVRRLDFQIINGDYIDLDPSSSSDEVLTIKGGKVRDEDKNLVVRGKFDKISYTVHVTDDGNPVKGARVEALPVDRSGPKIPEALTGPGGNAVLSLVPQSYLLRIRHEDYEMVEREISPSADNKSITLSLSKRPLVRGFVTDQDGPLANVPVVISFSPQNKRVVRSDGDGFYTKPLWEDGDFYIGVEQHDFTHFRKVTREDTIEHEVNIEVVERWSVQLRIEDNDELVKDRQASIYLVPEDEPEVVANIELLQGDRETIGFHVTPGVYEVYLLVSPEDSTVHPQNYTLYAMGLVSYREKDQTAIMSLNKDQPAMRLGEFLQKLEDRYTD